MDSTLKQASSEEARGILVELSAPSEAGIRLRAGRILFAVSICAFGVQHLIYGKLKPGLPPFPAWLITGHTAAYLIGTVLLALGLLVVLNIKPRVSSTAVALVLLIGSALQFLRFHDVVTDGNVRTQAFEALTLSGIAWVLAGSGWSDPRGWRSVVFGRALFCIAMVVFGLQHFQYLRYLTTLVPGWLPFHTFWIVFTGAAFLAASLSIFVGHGRYLASVLLSTMFFGWVCLLHIPRIVSHPGNGDEWSSGFVALALCGGSLLMAIAKPE